ncbi:MAG: formylglycine-generating enzyme family protein [Zoogloeaceae bacterium]|jgi:formylglycine-generating enzyme required for sulfatase activity|nr:formylglycine-generating enzyme family protein [Zoogloeaceae bacterium]
MLFSGSGFLGNLLLRAECDIMNANGFTPRKISPAWLGFSLTLLAGLTACGGGGGGGGGGEGDTEPVAGTEFNDCPAGDTRCPAMVVIPKGSFTMGSPDTEPGRGGSEGPQHEVTFAYFFAVGKTPVTVAQWDAFVMATSRSPNNFSASGCSGGDGPTAAPTSDSPVVCVNWNDAQAYAAWLSANTGKTYRLLSESEWEYAARAGTSTPYPFSDTLGVSDDVPVGDLEFANYANAVGSYPGTRDNHSRTSPVGTFPENGFGLYDMNGNVLEWTADCSYGDYNGAPTDGSVWGGAAGCNRVLRGGAWNSEPRVSRSACRSNGEPMRRLDNAGFRVARTFP